MSAAEDFKKLVETQFADLAKLFEEKIEGVKGRIDAVNERATFHFKIWVWVTGFMLTTIGAILGGGWAIFLSLSKDMASISRDIGELKGQFSSVKLVTDKLVNVDFVKLSSNIVDLANRTQSINPPPIRSSPIDLDETEKQIIRQFVGKESKPGARPLVQITEIVPDFLILSPFSDSLRNQVPKLRNTRYAIDYSGAILIVANLDNRVVAIVF
jgi:hypothetical protein